MRFLSLLLCILPAVLAAQEINTSPGAVLATIKADFNADGIPDKAVLFRRRNGDSSDVSLEIYENGGSGPVAFAPVIAWAGGIGQQPGLAALPNGSLQVISMNQSIGRDRWLQTVTIARRGGRYLVAGITHQWHDTLDPENYGTCDINLLTGKGELQKHGGPDRRFRLAPRRVAIADWDGQLPAECGPDF